MISAVESKNMFEEEDKHNQVDAKNL